MTAYARVALDVPLDGSLSYAVPDGLVGRVHRGTRVVVPFRAQARTGLVLEITGTLPDGVAQDRVRAIADVIDDAPCAPEAQIALAEWISSYYLAPLGEAMRLVLPPDGATRASRRVERVAGWEGLLPPSGAAQALLGSLTAGVPADPSAVVRGVRGALHADLDALERCGALRSVFDAGPRRTARTRARYVLGPSQARLGSRQREIVARVARDGVVDDAALRVDHSATAAVLRGLVERGVLCVTRVEIDDDPFVAPVPLRLDEPRLTDAQAAAITQICDGPPQTTLVHGVTGSGKTEVYVRAARHVLERGRRVLVLLPEIALTPQFVAVFRAAIPARIAVQHSGLSPQARWEQWRRIRGGEVDIVIGARSALFAPIDALGLIVVDEEHDPSFKQQDGTPYHARDTAIVLATRARIPCVLGSATPSLESLLNARRGRFALATLGARVAARPMPDVQLIDMSTQAPQPGTPSEFVSPALALEVHDAARRGEQSILFINRRGYAPTLTCRHCGEAVRCADCDVSMTLHRARHTIRCHYCDRHAPEPTACPTCRSADLDREGAGTERIEEIVLASFSTLRVGRLDRDSARGEGLERVLGAFRDGALDVLVGTQIVAKGHDFPNVTVVGVIDADQALRFPDFRAGERTFQLLSQVAGRAGRGARPGTVVVQTYRPDHFVLQAVATHDFAAFAEQELAFRRRLSYPPFGHLFVVRADSTDHSAAWRLAEGVAAAVRARRTPDVLVTGPSDAPVARVRGRYRVQLMVRGPDRALVHADARAARAAAASHAREARDLRWSLDIDAVRLL